MKDIVKILQQNARISNAALGEMLGISAEAAAAEIEKLEKSGVIKGYSVIVDDDLYDKSTVYATIELKVTPQRDCGFDDIAKTIMMYDEVESVSLMSSGAYDLAVEVKGMRTPTGQIQLTEKEFKMAQYLSARFYLYVVTDFAHTPKPRVIENPLDAGIAFEERAIKSEQRIWVAQIAA